MLSGAFGKALEVDKRQQKIKESRNRRQREREKQSEMQKEVEDEVLSSMGVDPGPKVDVKDDEEKVGPTAPIKLKRENASSDLKLADDKKKKKSKKSKWGFLGKKKKPKLTETVKLTNEEAHKKEVEDAEQRQQEDREAQAELAVIEQQQEGEKRLNEFEKKQAELRFKIDFYLSEILLLSPEDKIQENLNDTGKAEEEIRQLIDFKDDNNDQIIRFKIKVRDCLKELGLLINIRNGNQAKQIQQYVASLNEVVTNLNNLDKDNISIPTSLTNEKVCPSTMTDKDCSDQLNKILQEFDLFNTNVNTKLSEQLKQQTKFDEIKKTADTFKATFNGWIESITDDSSVEELEKLLGTIDTDTPVGLDVDDNNNLKADILKEIKVLIEAIKNGEKVKSDIDALEAEKKEAQVKIAALKDKAQEQEVKEKAEIMAGDGDSNVERKDTNGDEPLVEDKKNEVPDGEGEILTTDNPDLEEEALQSELEEELAAKKKKLEDERKLKEEKEKAEAAEKVEAEIISSDDDSNLSEDPEITTALEKNPSPTLQEDSPGSGSGDLQGEPVKMIDSPSREQKVKSIKDKLLPVGSTKKLEKTTSVGNIVAGKQETIKTQNTTPGEIGKHVEDVEVEPTSLVKKEVKKINKKTLEQEENEVGSSVISPQSKEEQGVNNPRAPDTKTTKLQIDGTTPPPPKGKKVEVKTGGRKKKSRRRRKSKKRKSKKNRR